MKCIYCVNEQYYLCENPGDKLCDEDTPPSTTSFSESPRPTITAEEYAASYVPAKRGAPVKTGDTMRNVLATGRKRSIEIAPIEPGDKCEWANLKFAGGGRFPIVGCTGSPAVDVHHGPDKSVLNNVRSNLHKLCKTCHNRWHTLNDPEFVPVRRPASGATWTVPDGLEHDPKTIATDKDRLEDEINWNARRIAAGRRKSQRKASQPKPSGS